MARHYSTTPTHDARHCGHVSRSESRTIKAAAVWHEVTTDDPTYTLPTLPSAVLAVLDAMRGGMRCADLGTVADTAAWLDDATDAQTVDGWLALPATPAAARAYGSDAHGLAFLLPLLTPRAGVTA